MIRSEGRLVLLWIKPVGLGADRELAGVASLASFPGGVTWIEATPALGTGR